MCIKLKYFANYGDVLFIYSYLVRMNDPYIEFPDFVTLESIQKNIYNNADKILCSYREKITCAIKKAVNQLIIRSMTKQNHSFQNGMIIPCDLRNINYKHLKIINDELTDRGFYLTYTVQITQYNSLCSSEIEFKDIDPYGDMPIQINIHITKKIA